MFTFLIFLAGHLGYLQYLMKLKSVTRPIRLSAAGLGFKEAADLIRSLNSLNFLYSSNSFFSRLLPSSPIGAYRYSATDLSWMHSAGFYRSRRSRRSRR
jgi:hypothetical protein